MLIEETVLKKKKLLDYPGPKIRLAHCNHEAAVRALETIEVQHTPNLLVAYPYLKKFLQQKHNFVYDEWVLDSGAFSAWNAGKEIDINKFMEECKHLMATDDKLVEIFALDVIGDWKASLKNAETMWNAGIPVIPCFHYGDPECALLEIAKNYPKIAVGGTVGIVKKRKRAFFKACFSRVWPKKVHAFGIASEDLLMSFPFHTADASSWNSGPCCFGNWTSFGNLSVRGKHDLRNEIVYNCGLEYKIRQKWQKQMQMIEEMEPIKPLKEWL